MPRGLEYHMCLRKLFISRWMKGEGSVASLAREFRISRATAHNWIRRYVDNGEEGLIPRPRRLHNSPLRTPDSVEALITAERRRYPYKGARTLRHELGGADAGLPSVRTVNRILGRNGLIEKRNKRSEAVNRFERQAANELWQMDHKASFHLGYGQRVVPFVVLDDASRFLIGVDLNPDKSFDSTWSSLWSFFGTFGLPGAILSDNAHVFAGHDGPSQLEARLIRLGVRIIHGRVSHPQTQGKVERVCGTMQRELLNSRRWRHVAELQAALDEWYDYYNFRRPHQALDMDVPAVHYLPSQRRRPGAVPPMTYPEGAVLRKVHSDGRISYRGARYEVGRGLAGGSVALMDTDGLLEIRYGDVLIGNFDIRPTRKHIKMSRCYVDKK